MRPTRRRADLARLEAEIEQARPYLRLAREINDQVQRAGTEGVGAEQLVEAIEAIPARERAGVVRGIFDQLPPDRQWEIVERAYGDAEIRGYLEGQRQRRLQEARRAQGRGALAGRARTERRLDTREVPAGEQVVLGLFVERDVAAALGRGPTSAACARRLGLRARDEPGSFQVLEDVFNPAGGYFVTGHYSEDTWRHTDRLAPHSIVRAGSLSHGAFEPVLYAGGRADFIVNGEPREGHLHVGYLTVGGDDVFSVRGGGQ